MWGVYEYHGSVYVIPEKDQKAHTTKADCDCHPRYENGIYIHSSYDCRESFETSTTLIS